MLAESYCDWWSLAGVDALVGEAPSGWLELAPANDAAASSARRVQPTAPIDAEPPPLPAALQRHEAAAPAAERPPVAPPGDWADFQRWLAEAPDIPGSRWDARRILPVGEAGASLMILTAWPEVDDQREGELFTGPAGTLLDAMLRAIGLARGDCYLASLAVTRPPGGRCDARDADELDRLLWHHLQLARPQRLLLVGGDMLRMAAGITMAAARGKLLDINHEGGKMVTVGVAHPATLLARPAQKSAAWDSLKLFNRGR